jgi:hypothetical protein
VISTARIRNFRQRALPRRSGSGSRLPDRPKPRNFESQRRHVGELTRRARRD